MGRVGDESVLLDLGKKCAGDGSEEGSVPVYSLWLGLLLERPEINSEEAGCG